MSSFRDLLIYKKAFELAMDIYTVSRAFPKEEKYSLTDQIRRSSRSVCSNVAEAYRKRRYNKHWISKLTDADMENAETQVWSDFSISCGYIDQSVYERWNDLSNEIGRLNNYMQQHPEKFR